MGEADKFLNDLFDTKLSELHTMLICRVVGTAGTKATVQPIGKRKGADGVIREYPQLVNLPVMSTRYGTTNLTPTYQSGDMVVVVFSERAIDRVIDSTGTVDPGSYRKHNINDGVVIGLIAGA
jgi:hypothetical protein